MTAVSKLGLFFDAAHAGVSADALKPEELSFLKAWFWDCDGCLVDSEAPAMGDLGRKIDEALKQAGHIEGLGDPDFVTSYAGWHADDIIKHISANTGVALDSDAVFKAHKTSVIETLKAEVQTFDGMDKVLPFMKQAAGGQMSVITSSEAARVIPCLEKTDLLKEFIVGNETRVYSAPDICPNNKKPKPHIYWHGLIQFDVDPKFTGTIEDSISGMGAATAANIGYRIGFVGGSHFPADRKEEFARKLMEAGAHTVIRDIRELPSAVLTVHREREMLTKASPASAPALQV